jgi:hypothetical protein
MKFFTIQTTMAIIQTDMNATELRIIEVVDKYVIYMLTENDKEKIIYSKLLELEGQELTDWINEELVEWLGNGVNYEFAYDYECKEDCKEDCEEDCEEHFKCKKSATMIIASFSINDYIQNILSKENGTNEQNFYDIIFTNCRELIKIQARISETLQDCIDDFECYYCLGNTLKNYSYIYLRDMDEGLKQYIMDLIEPTLIEPK